MNMEHLSFDCIDTVIGKDRSTGDLLFILDQIKDATLENANDTVYQTGKQGMQLSALDRNKTATFTCNNAYVVMGALASQVGNEVEEASATSTILVPDFQRISLTTATTAVLPHEPVGTAGAEVQAVWKINSDGSQGDKLVVGATVAPGVFTVDATTKTLTFDASEFSAEDEIYVDYQYEITEGRKVSNISDKFSSTIYLLADGLLRDKCDNQTLYHAKIEFPVAKVDGNFTIEIGEEPAVHAFSAKALTNVCSKNKVLWNYYVCA